MDADDNRTPVSSLGSSYSNPISVDEYLGMESEVEAEDQIQKEPSSPAGTSATELLETETVVTDILSAEAQEASTPIEPATTDSVAEEKYEVPLDRHNQNSYEIGTDDVDSVDSNGSRVQTDPFINEEDFIAKAEDDCKSEVIDVYQNSETNFDYSVHANSTNDSKVAVASDVEDGPSYRGDKTPVVQGHYVEPQVEAQEWTHEDHYASEDHKHYLSREQRRIERFERAEKRRIGKLMWFGVVTLLMEVAGAIIAVMNHQDLIECCGRSVFSENESVGERWNKVFFLIGILYIPVILLIEIPALLIKHETVFLFNPMVGFLLAMQMIYVTDLTNAYIIFGIEAVAMLGQSMVLMQMPRSFESCLHSVVNYTLAGMTIYTLVLLKQQGGYCIVDDRIQSVFSESTCNIGCIDEESCFRCSGGDDETSFTKCFIRFEDS